MIYIYRHVCPDGKCYIGKTTSLKRRWRINNYKKCTKFYNAILKFGWDNIKHEIITEVETEMEARKLEKDEIEKHNSIENGYNSINRNNIYKSTRKKPLRKVAQYSKKGELIKVYKSISEAIKETCCSSIRDCCSGRTKTACGFVWKYIDCHDK